MEAGGGFNGATSWSTELPGRQQVPNPTDFRSETWKPRISPVREREPQGEPMEVRVWDVGKSERRLVMRRIRVSTSPGTKVSPRPTGLSLQENRQKRLEMGEGKVRRWRSQTPVHSRLGERIGTPLSGARSSPESDGCRCVLRRLFARSAGVRSTSSNAHLSALCPQGSGRCEGLFRIQGSERQALTRLSGRRPGRRCKRLGRSGGEATNLSLSAGSTSPRGTASVGLWASRR
jgi:hypothetical protein